MTGSNAAGGPRSPTPTILLCEDEETLRELVRAVLGPEYRYAEAVDGVEALALARSVAPDLVLLDLMLPQASGFDVLAEIRRDANLRHTPVVVMSAWSHLEEAAGVAGADRFLSKPFDPLELAAIVQELLQQR